MELRYQAGNFYHLIATRPFSLGNTGVSLSKGLEVMFDGTKAQVEGSEYACPQLRGAVKADWLILAENYDENALVPRTRANIQVRHPTQGGNPMQPRQAMSTEVSEEEQVVGSTKSHAAQTRTANSGYVRGQTAINPRGVQAGQLVNSQRGVMEVELQDGQVVDRAPLQTAAGEKSKQTRVMADNASIIESQAAKVRITPVQGATRDELMDRMSPEEREEYISRISANKSQYVDEPPVQATARNVDHSSRQVVRQISAPQNGQHEGMQFTNKVGGGMEISDPTGLGGKAAESTYVQEGIQFRSVNGPKRDLQPSQHPRNQALVEGSRMAPEPVRAAPRPVVQLPPAVRLSIAKSVCPDFPDTYDFGAPEKKKLARISLDFEDRTDFLQAIYAAESDDFRSLLVNEYPAAFAQASV